MELQELYSYIQEHQPNICQISVLRGGNEICSAEWNGYQRTDCVHIASATKSVMALLTGIAIDHQLICSVNDKALSGENLTAIFGGAYIRRKTFMQQSETVVM